jgi:hypothetical protein
MPADTIIAAKALTDCRVPDQSEADCRHGRSQHATRGGGKTGIATNATALTAKRCASIGNGLAAAAMGGCGYFLTAGFVFIVTAALAGPALLALLTISSREIDPDSAHGEKVQSPPSDRKPIFKTPPCRRKYEGMLIRGRST